MHFIVIILFKIPQAYRDLVVQRRNASSFLFPTVTIKHTSLAMTTGTWRECQNWRAFMCFEPTQQVFLCPDGLCWISTTVNKLPCVRKQHTQSPKVQNTLQVCYWIPCKRHSWNWTERWPWLIFLCSESVMAWLIAKRVLLISIGDGAFCIIW